MAEDYYSERIYLDDKDVTVETNYRLYFDADKTCGFTRVFSGKVLTPSPEDEMYEIYMELHECGLTLDQVKVKESKVISEIREGKLDVSF
ncbi:MAG: hypothetical protein M1129_00445 [Candidatus Thermoplasmatota archaeon]|jgi:hypothetical protein|nr:hypothetical protein [Candidatus Thermoplasmatota archaeon]MCL5954491.1 hypothetical protein [Candidatus Thermoplasmatota archaeon]